MYHLVLMFGTSRKPARAQLSRRRITFICSVLLISFAISACNTNTLLFPTPGLEWLDHEETSNQSIMQSLAISISRLEDASVRERTDAQRQQQMQDQLQIIEELGELLAFDAKKAIADKRVTRSHRVVYEHIDTFLLQVRQARAAIANNPPDFFVAGKVAGYCQACHLYRDEQ